MVPHLEQEPDYGSSSSRLQSPSVPSRPEHLINRTKFEFTPDCPVAQNSMLSCRRGSGEPDLAGSLKAVNQDSPFPCLPIPAEKL